MPYQYPPEIDHDDFTDVLPVAEVVPRVIDTGASRSSFEGTHGSTLSTKHCKVQDLWLARSSGTRISQASFASDAEGIGGDATGRACFAPIQEKLLIRWELKNGACVRVLRLELFRRDDPRPLWTKRMTWKKGKCPDRGQTPFDGSFTADDGSLSASNHADSAHAHEVVIRDDTTEDQFPDTCVTVQFSPYKLALTIEEANGAVRTKPHRFLYFDVRVKRIQILWGTKADAEKVLPTDRQDITDDDNDFRQEIVDLEKAILKELRKKEPGDNHQVILRSDVFTTALNDEAPNDAFYRLHKDQWGDGPTIPLFALVEIESSRGRAVQAPEAIGNAPFLWDWEDTRGKKHDYWLLGGAPQLTKDYVRDALDYFVAKEFGSGHAPEGSTNTHVHHGGKRGEGAAPIFPPQTAATYDRSSPALLDGELPFVVSPCGDRKWAALSKARTRSGAVMAGHTGVLFRPSRMAGDIYKVSVYLVPDADFPFDRTADGLRAIPGLPQDATGFFETWRRLHVKYLVKTGAIEPCDVRRLQNIYEHGGTLLEVEDPVALDHAVWCESLEDEIAAKGYLAGKDWVGEALERPQPADDTDALTFKANKGTARYAAREQISFMQVGNQLPERIAVRYARKKDPDFKGLFFFHFGRKHRYLDPGTPEVPVAGSANSFLSTRRRSHFFVYDDKTSTYRQTDYDSPKVVKPRDPVIAHEIGHTLFIEHAAPMISSHMHTAFNGPLVTNGKSADTACIMNYHPDSWWFCGLCVLRLRGWSARGTLDPDNDGTTIPMVTEGRKNRVHVRPQITASARAVVVPRTDTTAKRLPITLTIDHPLPGQAKLSRATDAIHFFRTANGGADIFGGPNEVLLDSDELEAGLTLHAEAQRPSGAFEDVVLTLDPQIDDERAVLKLTAVKLTLDVHEVHTPFDGPSRDDPPALSKAAKRNPGRQVMVQNAGGTHERAMLIAKVEPDDFEGKLSLLRRGADGQVRVFDARSGGAAVLDAGDRGRFKAAPGGKKLWAEGSQVSRALRDVRLGLGVDGGQDFGDHVRMTAVKLDLEVSVPVTPHKTKRLKHMGVTDYNMPERTTHFARHGKDWDANPPLVLLHGSVIDDPGLGDVERDALAAPIKLIATSDLPGGGTLKARVRRASDDSGAVKGASPNDVPTFDRADKTNMKLLTDAVGSFRVHVFVDDDDSGTLDGTKVSVCLNLVLVKARLVEDRTVVTSEHCKCKRSGNDIVMRTHGYSKESFGYVDDDPDKEGDKVPLHLKVIVELIGGGADGKRGLDKVYGGWVNNITKDETGARYGKALNVQCESAVMYLHQTGPGTYDVPVPFGEDEPVLDKAGFGRGGGGKACLSTSEPRALLLSKALPGVATGCRAVVQALDAPSTGWDRFHIVTPALPIVQLWIHVEFVAYLCLWTSDEGYDRGRGSGLYGVLQSVKWRVKGKYDANSKKAKHTVTPLTVTIRATTTPAALVPACSTNVEVRNPTGEDMLRPRAVDATALGAPWKPLGT